MKLVLLLELVRELTKFLLLKYIKEGRISRLATSTKDRQTTSKRRAQCTPPRHNVGYYPALGEPLKICTLYYQASVPVTPCQPMQSTVWELCMGIVLQILLSKFILKIFLKIIQDVMYHY
jgi:hypothetical protein